jgi:hypothetical protein
MGRRIRASLGHAIALFLLLLIGQGDVALASEPGDAQKFDLLGTWYIVVHFRDEAAAGRQWEDKVWTFAYRGSRLLWTEYPVVLFKDKRGRSESLASGRSIRTSGSWRPNPVQLEEIAAGLSVNPQWARSKSLRGNVARGFRSSGSLNPTSASVIGYSETWEIEDPAAQTIFRRIDSMTSGRSDSLDGRTEYRSSARSPGEAVGAATLSGSFSRDGAQTGSFVMMRSGSIEFADPEEAQKKWK